jgi:hypothetical protein
MPCGDVNRQPRLPDASSISGMPSLRLNSYRGGAP